MTPRLAGLPAALAELVWPDRCPGCGRLGSRWCTRCAVELDAGLYRLPTLVRPDPCPDRMPPVLAAGPYAGPLRRLLHAYKDGDRRDLIPILAPILAVVIEQARGGTGMLVVPVPSSPASARRRGDRPLETLTRAAVDLTLPTQPACLVAPDVLRVRRRVKDQSTLTAAQRLRNLDGAMQVTRRWEQAIIGLPILLVDDIVTTGATTVACATALTQAGAGPIVVASVAATVRRRGANNLLPSRNSY